MNYYFERQSTIDEKLNEMFPAESASGADVPQATPDAAAFKSYYLTRFTSDLLAFFGISRVPSREGYPFVGTLRYHERENATRKTIRWKDINHYYMFSAAAYFMFTCTQVVGKLYGWQQMKNFMRASGWPLFSCGMGGTMHPLVMMADAELFPRSFEKQHYLDILHTASDYLTADFLDFLRGRAQNLDHTSYAHLCCVADPVAVEQELRSQQSLYEQFLADPDTDHPGMYLDFPE